MKIFLRNYTLINMIIILVAANWLATRVPGWQIDLSKNRINSISAVTTETIRNLNDIVGVKVFISKELPPEIKSVARDLRTILNQMENHNRSRLRVEYLDPLTDADAKKQAENYGIQQLQFSNIKSDKFEVQNAYFGLVISFGDKNEVLPVAGDVGNLEYFLTAAINRLTSDKIESVALVVDKNGGGSYEVFKKFLGQSYKLETADLTGDGILPETAGILIILGAGEDTKDPVVKKLGQWLDSGKGLIAYVDKQLVNQNLRAVNSQNSGMFKIFEDHGIKFDQGLVVDENSAIANFRTGNGSYLVKYPYWPAIRAEKIDRSIPVMSGINTLTTFWSSPLTLTGSAKALFSSSDKSAVDDSLNDLSPNAKIDSGKERQSYPLAAINTDKIKLAVIGDSDFLSDQFLQNNQQNLIFGLNLVDYFSQDNSLYQIRNKMIYVSNIRAVDGKIKTGLRMANLAVPLLILGIIYLWFNFSGRKKWSNGQ